MARTRAAHSERRSRTTENIDKFLKERQELLVLYSRVAGLDPSLDADHSPALLEKLCQIAIDYLAAGHFEVYQRVLDGTERRRAVQRAAERVYAPIAATTQYVVEFNDTYDGTSADLRSERFQNDLSALGEQLATRMELEDELIAALRLPA